MTITHSCCPEKCDITAPVLTLTETLRTSRGVLDVYTCVGCKTVIIVGYEPEDTKA